MKSPVTVFIDGDNQEVVGLVQEVVNGALTSAGFTNTTAIEPNTGEPIAGNPENVESMLDMVRKGNPELFTTPIQISTSVVIPGGDAPADDEVAEESEDPVEV